jgi:hypothetical protein
MRAAFSGTQRGMTPKQMGKVAEIFSGLSVSELHHGDCIGSDNQAHWLMRAARGFEFPINVHPCNKSNKRAFTHLRDTQGELILWEEQDPLERNHIMVVRSEILVATPRETDEILRSGTWATIRYATDCIPVRLVLPTGEVVVR